MYLFSNFVSKCSFLSCSTNRICQRQKSTKCTTQVSIYSILFTSDYDMFPRDRHRPETLIKIINSVKGFFRGWIEKEMVILWLGRRILLFNLWIKLQIKYQNEFNRKVFFNFAFYFIIYIFWIARFMINDIIESFFFQYDKAKNCFFLWFRFFKTLCM